MPGIRKAKHFHTLAAVLLTLAVLSLLPGCYAPRRSIPSDPAGATPQTRAQAAAAVGAEAAPEPEPVMAAPTPAPAPAPEPAAEPAPAKTETAPAKTETAPAKAEAAQAQAAEPAAAQAQTEKAATETQAARTDAAPAAIRQYSVQIGAFGTEKNAQGAVNWLKEKGFDSARMVRVEQGQSVLYRVRTGALQDLAAASKALETLKADWPQAFIPAD